MIAFSSAINLVKLITVCCGGVWGCVCSCGDSGGITLLETFNCFFLCENQAFHFRLCLGKSLVLFVRVTLYVVSTPAVEIISVVTVTDGDSRWSAIFFKIRGWEKNNLV